MFLPLRRYDCVTAGTAITCSVRIHVETWCSYWFWVDRAIARCRSRCLPLLRSIDFCATRQCCELAWCSHTLFPATLTHFCSNVVVQLRIIWKKKWASKAVSGCASRRSLATLECHQWWEEKVFNLLNRSCCGDRFKQTWFAERTVVATDASSMPVWRMTVCKQWCRTTLDIPVMHSGMSEVKCCIAMVSAI